MVALEAVEDERLVGLGNLQVGESSAVREVKLGDDGLHAEAGQLGVHLDIDTLIWLDAHDQLVARNVLEDARGDILELDSDLRLLLVKRLSCLHDEGHTIPPLVLDVGNKCAECGAARVLGHRVILLVCRLAAIQGLAVLANDDILGLDGGDGAENADLLVTNVLRGEGNGPLHGEQCQDLEKVVLHNVADYAELVEVSTTTLGTERLLESDLHIVDVMSVPGRTKERVPKAENQYVLHHLLAQVVVNAEDLVLLPVRLQGLLQLSRAGKVLPKWLLNLQVERISAMIVSHEGRSLAG